MQYIRFLLGTFNLEQNLLPVLASRNLGHNVPHPLSRRLIRILSRDSENLMLGFFQLVVDVCEAHLEKQ